METEFTKRYYKIREVSELLGVPQSTLRYWENEFEELKPMRSAHNQRFYSPKDLELLEIIQFLLYTKGLKVESARDYIKHNRKNISRQIQVKTKLEGVKKDLQILLQSLNLRAQKLGFESK